MSKRLILIFLAAALTLAIPTESVMAQTRPAGAIGYSAAERRSVDQRIADLTIKLQRLSNQRVVSPRLMRAIAFEVGLANPQFTDAQLLAAVETMAERANELQADNSKLRHEIERLSDLTVRDPALALLSRAENALNDGRLNDAEALYDQLRSLRWDESRAAQEAWNVALDAMARTSELRQDFVRAQDLRLEASDRLQARSKADYQRAFEQAEAAAWTRYREGLTFGRANALQAAISLYDQRVMPMASRENHPRLWGWAQNNLGLALYRQGQRSGGEEGKASLARAVSIFEAALEVRTRTDIPAEWARTQNNLGVALSTQGQRIGGEEGQALLRSAVSAFEAALEVRTRKDMPTAWAATQNDLGNTLSSLSQWYGGEEGKALRVRSVLAFEAAMEVNTRADRPIDWASHQNNLGVILMNQGEESVGEDGRALLRRAVSAFEAALEVRTRADLPSDWAATQSNLGSALMRLAEVSAPEEALSLTARAIEAHEAALEVRTRTDMPADWAATQTNLGNALYALADLSSPDEAQSLLGRAIEAHKAALEVNTRKDMPADWAIAQNNLGNAQRALGILIEGEGAEAQLKRAVEAIESSLEVWSRNETPAYWATAQNSLGQTLTELGTRQDDKEIIVRAVGAYRSALEVTTFTSDALSWARLQRNLGRALLLLGSKDGKNNSVALAQGLDSLRQAQLVLTETDYVEEWIYSTYMIAFASNVIASQAKDIVAMEQASVLLDHARSVAEKKGLADLITQGERVSFWLTLISGIAQMSDELNVVFPSPGRP